MNRPFLLRPRAAAYAIWLIVAIPTTCQANAGLPLIFVALPMMVIGLIPIVFAETILARRHLKLAFKRVFKGIAISNLASTLIGIPLTWFILVLIQIATGGDRAYGLGTPISRVLAVTWQAPWLIPYRHQMNWMIPAATLVLLVPFFFASWWIEYHAMKRIFQDVDRNLMRKAIRNANFLSYTGLALYVMIDACFR